MELIIAIDDLILSFFTKISHKFYRLTGRTNFFLAKLAICVMVASVMTVVFSYWFPPMLGFQPSIFYVVLSVVLSILCLFQMVLCDKAEKSTFNDERVRMFSPLDYSPLNRVFWIFLALTISFIELPILFNGERGYFIFKALHYVFPLAFIAFKYFVSVDPPSPGKSKIREWIELFSAVFQKRAPIKIKN